jgi:DNA-binding MarR family transcriptional regulator
MKKLFTPQYVPYFIFLEDEGLNHTDIKLFGFIYFYLQTSSNTFYFTNKDLSKILKVSERRVSASFSKLVERRLIYSKMIPRDTTGVYRLVSLNNEVITRIAKSHTP